VDDPDRIAKSRCTRFLSQHMPASPAKTLLRLAETQYAQEYPDFYGDAGAVAALEARTAHLLGKPAARFFIKGMTAQLCSFRAHADRAGTNNLLIHPMSHLDVDEANAIERVGGMAAIRLGRFAPFSTRELESVTEPLAAVSIELPLRRAGYRLPSLDELRAMSAWCRARGIPLHFDGARLWEAAAGYGVALADLAALADTIYVSFYKGLGGLGGAILAGSEEHVRSLGVWKTRYAGNLFTAFPYAIAALDGLDTHLPRMSSYVERARKLAIRLRDRHRGAIHPFPPQTNAFQILLEGTPADLKKRNRDFAGRRGVWLFSAFVEAPQDGWSIGEVVIGDAADHYDDAEAAEWLGEFSVSS
jgi:threonine aldolase